LIKPIFFAALAGAVFISLPARAQSPPPAPVKAPKMAVCAVCGPREGSGPEAVAATLKYRGRTYSFCQEQCRIDFQQDPERWIKLAQTAKPEAGHEHEAEEGHNHGSGAGSAAPG